MHLSPGQRFVGLKILFAQRIERGAAEMQAVAVAGIFVVGGQAVRIDVNSAQISKVSISAE